MVRSRILWPPGPPLARPARRTLALPHQQAAHTLRRRGRWAYEHKNEEAIEMLQAAGVNEDAKDRGSRPSRPAHCAAVALPLPRRPSAHQRHCFLRFAPS